MTDHTLSSGKGAVGLEPAEESGGHGVARIAIVAALGGFLFGYDSSVINGAVSAIQNYFHVAAGPLGFAVASALLGAALGAIFAGRIADRIGRLKVMRIAALLFLIAAIGTGIAPDLAFLIILRFIGGCGIGVASVIAPAYIAEVSPARIRGRLASLQQLAIVTGIFISLLIDYIFFNLAGHNANGTLWLGAEAWRWMFFAMLIPALLYGGLSLTIPESPRYLIAKQRIPEARKIIARLTGERNLEIRIDKIRESVAREKPPAWRDLRGSALGLLPIVWIGLFLSIFQQFVGINVIFYYSNVLWHAVGFSSSASFLFTVISAIINIATTIIAIASIDKIGRKPLLLIGSAGMFVTLGTMAAIFGTAKVVNGTPSLGPVAGPIALVAANLFVVSFGMSWGPCVWVLLGEMFPNRIRAAALGLAAAGQWVANWVITVTFPTLKDISLGLAYGIYATCALLSLLFVMRWVKETKGKQLEDMTTEMGSA
jgi:sugar porter (SP) family MFS transporter